MTKKRFEAKMYFQCGVFVKFYILLENRTVKKAV